MLNLKLRPLSVNKKSMKSLRSNGLLVVVRKLIKKKFKKKIKKKKMRKVMRKKMKRWTVDKWKVK